MLPAVTRRPFHIAAALCTLVAAGVAAGVGSLSWAGNVAPLILLGGAGALLAPLTARVQIPARPEVARRVGIALLAGLGAAMYLPPLLTDGGFLGKGDWGVHHALVQVLVDAGGIPPWVPTVSTGDPSFELYPALPYLLAATVVRWLGGDAITVLYGIGAAAHVLIAIGSARLAYRMGHWSLGWGIGLLALLDSGGYSGGGSYAVIQMGLYANAVSQALFLLALPMAMRTCAAAPMP